MSKLEAYNDYFLVEITGNEFGIQTATKKEGIETGTVVAQSSLESFVYYGMANFAFDKSLGDDELLTKLHTKYAGLVGKKIYWPAYSERGTEVHFDGKDYVFVKFSAVMGVVEG